MIAILRLIELFHVVMHFFLHKLLRKNTQNARNYGLLMYLILHKKIGNPANYCANNVLNFLPASAICFSSLCT